MKSAFEFALLPVDGGIGGDVVGYIPSFSHSNFHSPKSWEGGELGSAEGERYWGDRSGYGKCACYDLALQRPRHGSFDDTSVAEYRSRRLVGGDPDTSWMLAPPLCLTSPADFSSPSTFIYCMLSSCMALVIGNLV